MSGCHLKPVAFDYGRDGFVMAENAGLLVIESLQYALARGAKPLAELVSYGTSALVTHPRGATRAESETRRMTRNNS